MSKEYTPGPWKIIDNKGQLSIANEKNINCCYRVNATTMDRKRNAANAQLIAAAPELLEALERAVKNQQLTIDAINADADWYNNNMPGVGQELSYKERAVTPDWMIQAKAAIKKATEGGQG